MEGITIMKFEANIMDRRRIMVPKHKSASQTKSWQIRELQEQLEARNVYQTIQEWMHKRKPRQSWIRPWLHGCRHIGAYPIHERDAIFHHYIPLEKLPWSLAEISSRKLVTPKKQFLEAKENLEELDTLVDVFSTPIEFRKLGLSSPKLGSPKKKIFKLLSKNLFSSTGGLVELLENWG